MVNTVLGRVRRLSTDAPLQPMAAGSNRRLLRRPHFGSTLTSVPRLLPLDHPGAGVYRYVSLTIDLDIWHELLSYIRKSVENWSVMQGTVRVQSIHGRNDSSATKRPLCANDGAVSNEVRVIVRLDCIMRDGQRRASQTGLAGIEVHRQKR